MAATPFPVLLPGGGPLAAVLAQVEVDHVSRRPPPPKGTPPEDLPAAGLASHLLARFGGQVFAVNQAAAFEFQGVNYTAKVLAVATAGGKAGAGGAADGHPVAAKGAHDAPAGLLTPDTAFVFAAAPGAHLAFPGQARGGVAPSLFKGSEVSFAKLGIGGLDAQFDQIFRRAFASRVFPPAVVERMGIHHVRGVLLYGPPGTGKTLIARQIGKMLNGRDPKIVNGPEILNKYVGASEENVRALFKDAEEEQAARGAESDLHVIIFDEIDAICKQRGSGGAGAGAGVHDTVVNQLLTKIDGVDALDNILLIGMTNRRDMLDDALLRPGRLEVQVEVGLPDEAGRAQIFAIHTARMAEHAFLGADVDLGGLAARTKNFSGAEIEGLVKSAASFALNRQVRRERGKSRREGETNPKPLLNQRESPPACTLFSRLLSLTREPSPHLFSPSSQVDFSNLGQPVDEDAIKVGASDFEAALAEVTPAFGASPAELAAHIVNGMIDYGDAHRHLVATCTALVDQVRSSAQTPLLTCLLEGGAGAGKTALAASVGLASAFPLVRMVSPDAVVGQGEAAKAAALARAFDDAYKSPLSLLILDDIERLLEYVAIGPRFSNVVLQTLLVLLKKPPPPGRRLLVLGTTSVPAVMDDLGIAAAFNVCLTVPRLREPEMRAVLAALDAFAPGDVDLAIAALMEVEVPIKRLLMLLEMARQSHGGGGGGEAGGGGRISITHWNQVLRDLATG